MIFHFYDIGWNKRSGKKKLKTMIFVAVIDIKIVAKTGADLNHLVRNSLKNDFISFIRLQMNQLEMHQSVKVMKADSKEQKLLRQ